MYVRFCKYLYKHISVSSASLVYTLDNVTSRLVGDIFSCFFLKVPRAANGQFTYAYQESLRKVCVSRRVCRRRPYVLNSCTGSMIRNFMSIYHRSSKVSHTWNGGTIFIGAPVSLPLEDHYRHSKMFGDSMNRECQRSA